MGMIEADTVAFVDKVLSEATRDVQTKAVGILASTMQEKIVRSGSSLEKPIKLSKKPVSQFSSKALWHIVAKHMSSLLSAGPKGLYLLLKLGAIATRIALASSVRAVFSSCFHMISVCLTRMGKACLAASQVFLGSSSASQ